MYRAMYVAAIVPIAVNLYLRTAVRFFGHSRTAFELIDHRTIIMNRR